MACNCGGKGKVKRNGTNPAGRRATVSGRQALLNQQKTVQSPRTSIAAKKPVRSTV